MLLCYCNLPCYPTDCSGLKISRWLGELWIRGSRTNSCALGNYITVLLKFLEEGILLASFPPSATLWQENDPEKGTDTTASGSSCHATAFSHTAFQIRLDLSFRGWHLEGKNQEEISYKYRGQQKGCKNTSTLAAPQTLPSAPSSPQGQWWVEWGSFCPEVRPSGSSNAA